MALLTAAVQDGYGALVPAEQQCADAVGAADLVAADRHGGEAAVAEVDVELPEGLDGVGVQRDPGLAGDGRQFADRHDGADLVVGPHDGGQGHVVGVALDGLAEGVGVDAPVAVHGQVLDLRALVLGEPVDGVEHGVVLDGAGDDPGPGGVGVAPRPVEALDGEVVGLRAAGGEDHLAGAGADRLGEGFAGLLHGTAGPAARGVQGGGVPRGGELRGHRRGGLRQHRGGGGVVEVGHDPPILRVRRWPLAPRDPVMAGKAPSGGCRAGRAGVRRGAARGPVGGTGRPGGPTSPRPRRPPPGSRRPGCGW